MSKIALNGRIDPQIHFYQVIDDYFGNGGMEKDLDALPEEKRLQIMGKFAEFRWGKKTAEAADGNAEVNTTSDLLRAVHEKMNGGQ